MRLRMLSRCYCARASAMAEFTIANYAARPNSIGTGYSRRRDFGLITLSHPALFGEPGDSKMTEDALHELYDRTCSVHRQTRTATPSSRDSGVPVHAGREDPQSPSRLHERIDELFEAYDQDANGVLDIRELREARDEPQPRNSMPAVSHTSSRLELAGRRRWLRSACRPTMHRCSACCIRSARRRPPPSSRATSSPRFSTRSATKRCGRPRLT
jgi:hypothetical protein